MVAGHDIGGGVAQHLMLAKEAEVPCPAAATTRDDVLAARRVFVVKALGRPGEAEIAEYLDPWTPGSLDPG